MTRDEALELLKQINSNYQNPGDECDERTLEERDGRWLAFNKRMSTRIDLVEAAEYIKNT